MPCGSVLAGVLQGGMKETRGDDGGSYECNGWKFCHHSNTYQGKAARLENEMTVDQCFCREQKCAALSWGLPGDWHSTAKPPQLSAHPFFLSLPRVRVIQAEIMSVRTRTKKNHWVNEKVALLERRICSEEPDKIASYRIQQGCPEIFF